MALNEALEEQEEAVRARDFTLAGLCKQKVDNIQRKLEELNAALKDTVQMKEPTTEIVCPQH